MKIDWFTFVAQIVNFLVLVALLRWVLYDRIVHAMKQREEKIANRLREADRERANAQEKVREYEKKIRQIDQQREGLLDKARHEAQEEHQRLLKEAKREVEEKRGQWRDAYRREREDLMSELRRQAGRSGVEAARHTLSQLADAQLEERMCHVFAARLRELGDEQRGEIAEQLVGGDAKVTIRSAFDLSDDRRKCLHETIRDVFDYEKKIHFEKQTELICGLELHLGGYSLGWNVKTFLQDLETQFDERLSGA